jgi:dihydropteroate synthase
MGVINATPDSFSDGGKYIDPHQAARRAREMAEEGAGIIDIGGESSRPGSENISAKEEARRVIPVIKAVKEAVSVALSIDTYKEEVARKALEEGVSLVNDITALRGDPAMAGTVAEFGAGVVLMHMKGTPGMMQDDPRYDDVMKEIIACLSESILAAESAGIDPEKIIVDPGIGFGKKLEHNLTILKDLRQLEKLGKPILVGTSRKSFIGELTGKDTSNRIFGTAASIAAAIMNGASIVRVHDVASARDVTRVIDAIKGK